MKQTFHHLKRAVQSWWAHDPFTQSAAVAYYTIFSFPALLILYFASASLFVEKEELHGQTNAFLSQTFGAASAEQFGNIIQNTAPNDTSNIAFVIGGCTLLYAGLRLFLQFQKALNNIWGINNAYKGKFTTMLIRRAVSFGVMGGIGITLVASLLLTSSIHLLAGWLATEIHPSFDTILHLTNLGVSFVTISIMFMLVLKILPDRPVQFRHALYGAMLSAALFILGEFLLGIYFNAARPDSAYGVTGSIILLMLWVSYSCIILLLGAELSKILSDHDESKAVT